MIVTIIKLILKTIFVDFFISILIKFYHDLNKYILKPERIEKMAGKYGIDFIDYLDAIDV
jgi:hypothetical protein